MNMPEKALKSLDWSKSALLIIAAAACFHIAYFPASSGLSGLFIVGCVLCVIQLAGMQTVREAFYAGLATGLLFYPQINAAQLAC